jgi:hypothetical protein
MTKQRTPFDPKDFISTVGAGREMMSFRKGRSIFAQDDVSDAVFVIQTVRCVRLSSRSQSGKEALRRPRFACGPANPHDVC